MDNVSVYLPKIKNILLNNLFSYEVMIDESIKNQIKDDITVKTPDNSSITIQFSTKHFPSPIRLSFLQRRLKETFEIFIQERKILNDILIAIEEAVMNIIEHSYNHNINNLIQFSFEFNKSYLIIEIQDFGKEGKYFNIENAGEFKTQNDLIKSVKKSGRGMGVYLIKKIMDDVKYEVINGAYNKIIMKKNTDNLEWEELINNELDEFNEIYSEDIFIHVLNKNNKYVILSLEGYLNMDTSRELHKTLNLLEREYDPASYIFDISKIEYISSSGIEVFMDALRIKEEINKNISFIGMNENVRRVLNISGFIKYFGNYKNLREAERNLGIKLIN